MKTKHTKGEWYVTKDNANELGVRTRFGYICFLPKPTHYTNQDVRYKEEIEECKANAKLIAAAPEMLEVLESIENDSNQVPEWLWLRIKSVIKKATE